MKGALRAGLTAAVALALAVAVRAEWPLTRGPSAATAPFPAPGSQARDFALPVLGATPPFVSRDTLRLSDFAGRYVYLDVFGSWCLPCRQKYPDMINIAGELDATGAVTLGLLLQDAPQAAAAYFADNGGQAYPFLILDDATARTWGLTGAPMGFLISPEGLIERLCYGCQRGASSVETLPAAVRAGLSKRLRSSP